MPAPKKYATAAQRQAAYRARCEKQREAELASKGMQMIPPMPGKRRWDAMRIQALCLVEQLVYEMEMYYEERSERWQDSERGEAFSEAMESATEVAAALKEIPSF